MLKNLSIRAKVLLFTFLLLILSFGIGWHIIQRDLEAGTAEIEWRELKINTLRVSELLADQITYLGRRIGDWASWDDSYRFLLAYNKSFEDANLSKEALASLEFDSVRFYNKEGFFYRGIDKIDSSGLSSIQYLLDTYASSIREILPPLTQQGASSGMLHLEDSFIRFAIAPVRPTSGQGEGVGYVAFFSRLDTKFLEKVSLQSKTRVVMQEYRPGEGEFARPEAKEEVEIRSSAGVKGLSAIRFTTPDSQEFQVQIVFADAFERPALQFEFRFARDIRQLSQKTLKGVLSVYSLTGLALCVLFMVGIDTTVIRPIRRVRSNLMAIQESVKSSLGRIDLKREDEIGDLAHGINSLLDAVESAQHDKQEEERQRQEGQEKILLLGELFTDLSHELKNIVNQNRNLEALQEVEMWPVFAAVGLEGNSVAAFIESIKHQNFETETKALTYRNADEKKFLDSHLGRKLAHYVSFYKLSAEAREELWRQLLEKSEEELNFLVMQLYLFTQYQSAIGNLRRCNELSLSVLDYTRSQTVDQDSSLAEILAQIKILLQARLTRYKVQLNVEGSFPESVAISQGDLTQILLNLHLNAIDAIAQLEENMRWITWSLVSDAQQVYVHIKNGGPPIPQEIQSFLFERGFSTKGEKGNGIGLSVSRKLARKWKGELNYKADASHPEFVLTLDLAQ